MSLVPALFMELFGKARKEAASIEKRPAVAARRAPGVFCGTVARQNAAIHAGQVNSPRYRVLMACSRADVDPGLSAPRDRNAY